MRTTWFSLALAAIGAALLPSLAAPAHAAGDERVLVLGRISDDPKAHYEQLKPLLDYVVPRMRDVGITEGRILMARDAQQMTSYLRRGRVDWVTETAGTGMQLQQRAGARALLLTERGGVSRYHGVFFVRRDSGLERLSDLEGRTVAFQNTASTSAYFAPATALLDAGQRLEILLSPMDRPSADAVGYVFARSELNIAAWVHKRLVDAGVVSNLDWDDVRRMPPAFRRDFRVIHETQDFPRALEMVRGDLDPKIEARLREVLLEAAQDPAAREALSVFFRTTRFLPVDPASQRALDDLRGGVARVREQLE
ncbi:phosphate/phosphite/phosphonate ABC transporter substrate-binding protein [Pseudoxanthomonas mexicana]|uniref:phosphate/phosphite/phosphonate ABC transporter substrate-binding protein n=1 Tax=Pseudoxanthomonas mexicana TaxID=128785 RepID=UPI003D2F9961